MIGLPVGSWDDEVDPDRVIKEVVGDSPAKQNQMEARKSILGLLALFLYSLLSVFRSARIIL